VALFVAAGAATLLSAAPRERALAIGTVLLLAALLRLDRPLREARDRLATYPGARERAATVRYLDEHPGTPYAAEYWASIYDVVYLRRDRGTWTFGEDVERLRDREIVAITHETFTNKRSRFYEAVVAGCEPLTPSARLIRLHRCGARFWERFAPPAGTS
jgi:hypothetical protein